MREGISPYGVSTAVSQRSNVDSQHLDLFSMPLPKCGLAGLCGICLTAYNTSASRHRKEACRSSSGWAVATATVVKPCEPNSIQTPHQASLYATSESHPLSMLMCRLYRISVRKAGRQITTGLLQLLSAMAHNSGCGSIASAEQAHCLIPLLNVVQSDRMWLEVS